MVTVMLFLYFCFVFKEKDLILKYVNCMDLLQKVLTDEHNHVQNRTTKNNYLSICTVSTALSNKIFITRPEIRYLPDF